MIYSFIRGFTCSKEDLKVIHNILLLKFHFLHSSINEYDTTGCEGYEKCMNYPSRSILSLLNE